MELLLLLLLLLMLSVVAAPEPLVVLVGPREGEVQLVRDPQLVEKAVEVDPAAAEALRREQLISGPRQIPQKIADKFVTRFYVVVVLFFFATGIHSRDWQNTIWKRG